MNADVRRVLKREVDRARRDRVLGRTAAAPRPIDGRLAAFLADGEWRSLAEITAGLGVSAKVARNAVDRALARGDLEHGQGVDGRARNSSCWRARW